MIECQVSFLILWCLASFLVSNQRINEETDLLQSLLVFLHEQSASSCVSVSQVCDCIRYLRHFAQLGLLYQHPVLEILHELHRAKDRDHLNSEQLTHVCERLQSIDYVRAYDHLNLLDLDHFLNSLIVHGK
jgi:hypothetical protein